MRRRLLPLLVLLAFLAPLVAGCTTVPGSDPDGEDPEEPAPIDGDGEIVWGTIEDAAIRPGAEMRNAEGGLCTYNWLFTDEDHQVYIGTAGHCTGSVGERVLLGGTGTEIGMVVYDSDRVSGADERVDFTLIRLDADQVANAHPAMFGFDGPKASIEAGEASPGEEVAIYGHGIVLGQDERTRARFGVLVDEDGERYRADLPAVNGDSGSPLIHVPTGKAFGIISQYGADAVPPSTDQGPIMPFVLDELAKAGLEVTLVTV